MGRLNGNVAIVTGAARGTGEATARRFVEEGARVVVADVDVAGGEAVAKELGDAARFERLDVGAEDEWARVVGATVERWGALDVLVNNAALLHLAALEDTTPEDFERLVRVNQIGPFLGIRAATEPMRAAGGGSIVNVSSVDGRAGKNGVVAYASTKWALRGITRVAALELGRFGIRVNAVCPEAGSIDMIRPYLPEGLDFERIMASQQPVLATQRGRTTAERIGDVAAMVLFLASDESASCTGSDFTVDGGNTAGKIVKGAPGS
ncbi:MAG: SDR family oxidoreductase [Myxococcales bacterium]|nr:SDR family oxidoreductase [Myxococcales bacterium]